jgi:hypothetical protein
MNTTACNRNCNQGRTCTCSAARPWLVQDRPWLGRRVEPMDFITPEPTTLLVDDDFHRPVTQPIALDEARGVESTGHRLVDFVCAVVVCVMSALLIGGAL